MSLEKFTTEQLLDEIKSRESEKSDHLLYIGIVDSEGLESMTLVSSPSDLRLESLQLRARINSQRSPIVYAVRMPKVLAETIQNKARNGGHREAGTAIKTLSTFRSLGY